jgi:CheY-like chemotaxis protein
MHALLVDDNQIDRRQIRRLLQQTNPKVKITEASDAITAFEALQRTRFDCLVVDQRMPGSSAPSSPGPCGRPAAAPIWR